MRYDKPWKSVDEQAKLLIDNKGLVCGDEAELKRALVEIGYYRLSAYWFPYKVRDDDGRMRFLEGTTLEMILHSYEFDRRLRILVFDAIGKIEVYLRSRLAYLVSREYGAFGYPDAVAVRLKREFSVAKRSEQYVKHFVTKYGDEHELPPYWVMTECLTMGTIELLFSSVSPQTRTVIASEFDVRVPILKSWIAVLRAARNACCHHSRVWNRTWGVKPIIPKAWEGFTASNDRTFAVLSVVYYLLTKISGADEWRRELETLLTEFDDIPLNKLGFPDRWSECNPWTPLEQENNKNVESE